MLSAPPANSASPLLTLKVMFESPHLQEICLPHTDEDLKTCDMMHPHNTPVTEKYSFYLMSSKSIRYHKNIHHQKVTIYN